MVRLPPMTPKTLRDEILQLTPDQRLELVEDIWDSLTPDQVPLPEWHKLELDRRLDHPEPGVRKSWEEVRGSLRDRGK